MTSEDGDETNFWNTVPGAREDVEEGRALSPEDLYDEKAVRDRYQAEDASPVK